MNNIIYGVAPIQAAPYFFVLMPEGDSVSTLRPIFHILSQTIYKYTKYAL
jgi:hypothetical protein